MTRGNAEIGLELDSDFEHGEVLQEIVRESSTMSRMTEDLLFLSVISQPITGSSAPVSFGPQSSCSSPESILSSLARGSLSYSAVMPTVG